MSVKGLHLKEKKDFINTDRGRMRRSSKNNIKSNY